jgi:hypothetical protein
LLRKSTKFVLEFCGLDPLGILALVDIATSVASTVIFYEFPHEPLALLSERFYHEKLLAICVKEKIFKQRLTYSPIVASSLFGGNPFVDGILGHNLLLSRAFSVGIPSWMGF